MTAAAVAARPVGAVAAAVAAVAAVVAVAAVARQIVVRPFVKQQPRWKRIDR